MKLHRRFLAGSVVAALSAFAALAAIGGGPPNAIQFQMNVESFGNEFGGASPERAVQTAGTTWAWSAGMRRHYNYTGTTTALGCGFFNPHHVYGSPGIDPGNPSLLGYFFYCPLGGWEIRTWLGGANFTLDLPASDQIDFQAFVTHELGHDTTPFHTSASDCLMSAQTSAGHRRRWFCTEDIENIAGNGHGHARGGVMRAVSSTSSWPQPGNSGWSTYNRDFYGFGFVAFERGVSAGLPVDIFYRIATNNWLHGMQRCKEYEICYDVAGLTALESLHRPTVTFDFRRNRWWLFWLIKANDEVQYATSNDGINFVYHGSVGPSVQRIRTRVPVSATYDNISDSIVVAYANFAGITGSNLGGSTYDTALVSLAATNAGGSWFGPYQMPGRQTDMPPAIACQNTVVSYRCQLLRQAIGGSRSIISWRVDLAGAALSAIGADTDTGGLTNYPIGLSFNGPNSAGSFAAFVSGAAGTNQMWHMHKKNVWDSWSGWSVVQGISSSYLGPQVALRESDGNYVLLFAESP